MTYRGPIRAVILDWAGTTVDFGCQAPVQALREVFAERGVEITVDEARRDMGLLKKDHIQALCRLPRVRQAWAERFGAAPAAADVDALFERFLPKQLACLERCSDLLPGVAEAVGRMRRRGIRIGSTTGYTRAMLDVILPKVRQQGYEPDSIVTPEETGAGRPYPWMCYLNAIRLRTYPLRAFVKIGDTPSDIEEGINAGMWTIGVTDTGNEVGLTEAEWKAAPPRRQQDLRDAAARRLRDAGADFIVPALAECDSVLDQIEQRLREGD